MDDLSWLDGSEVRVMRAFARSARRLFVQFDRDLQREAGMPRLYFEILWLLDQAPDRALRMSDLAEATGSQPSRITHAVGTLEKAGRVRRELCSDDRRGWFAVLTDHGAEALHLAAPVYARSIRTHLLAPLTARQRGQLAEIGEALLRDLDRSGAAAPAPSAAAGPVAR